jgi:hypothetical protein
MAFNPPNGVAFHITDEIPVADLCALLRRVIAFLQNLDVSSPRLRLYHDWWEHDGLHFDERRTDFHKLFAMVDTPRAILDATPDEHAVFVGVAPEDSRWYLRFRAEWDGDEKNIVGRFAVVLPAELVVAFKQEIVSPADHPLAEMSSESYYKRVNA